MKIGNVELVAWVFTGKSERDKGWCKLIASTRDMNVQFSNEEYYVTEKEVELLREKYPLFGTDRLIEKHYLNICKKQKFILISFAELEKIEKQIDELE